MQMKYQLSSPVNRSLIVQKTRCIRISTTVAIIPTIAILCMLSVWASTTEAASVANEAAKSLPEEDQECGNDAKHGCESAANDESIVAVSWYTIEVPRLKML